MARTAEPFTLRQASKDDLDSLCALESVFPQADRATRRNWVDLLGGNSAVLVIDGAGGLAAAMVLLFRKGSRVARIYSMAVAPEAQGHGLARQLLAAANEEAARRRCDRVRLEVRLSNHRARALYECAGFGVIAQKPGYYADGETALHMEKLLPAGDTSA